MNATLTPADIYSNDWLRARAEQVVFESLEALSLEEAIAFAEDALDHATRAGCKDAEYLDILRQTTLI
jgi:hypothetical protein